MATIKGEMKTSFEGLVKLLARNLYSDDDAFVRELVQNAQDSIVKRKLLKPAQISGVIEITIGKDSQTITVEDNGAGMTRDEIDKYLSTIGRSGTGELRSSLAEGNRQVAQQLIGQFGIGILSAFVVARRITVETRSVEDNSAGLRWINDGGQFYTLEECDKSSIGTRVTLYIDEKKHYMTNAQRLRDAVRRYADFIPQRILVQGEQANIVDAPWHRLFPTSRERDAAYAEFIARRFPDHPVDIIPVDVAEPYIVQGVLYISDNRIPDINTAGMVDIYQARMFVTEEQIAICFRVWHDLFVA